MLGQLCPKLDSRRRSYWAGAGGRRCPAPPSLGSGTVRGTVPGDRGGAPRAGPVRVASGGPRLGAPRWGGRGSCARGAMRPGPAPTPNEWDSLRKVFGIASNTLVRPSQSSSGPAGAGPATHPTATGWDEELRARTAGERLPRPGHSESSLRMDSSICPVMLRHRYR